MPNDETLRGSAVDLHGGHRKAGGAGRHHDTRRSHVVYLGEQRDLPIEHLRSRLLHEVRRREGIRQRTRDGEPFGVGAVAQPEPLDHRPRVRDARVKAVPRVRHRIVREDVEALAQEMHGPTTPDGAGADDGDRTDGIRGTGDGRAHQKATLSKPLRSRISRASVGVATSSESSSRMRRILRTWSALDGASWPLPM